MSPRQRWTTPDSNTGKVLDVRYSPTRKILLVATITIAFSFLMGAFISQIHLLLSTIFPEKASFPYLDALTTIMSFTAMWLMVQKRIESWIYWIIVDMIGIWLYYVKEVKFIAFLYVILLFIAVNGLISWLKTAKITDS